MEQSMWIVFLNEEDGAPYVPPGSDIRITEDTIERETENIDLRITE
jgi:hypothetical protein